MSTWGSSTDENHQKPPSQIQVELSGFGERGKQLLKLLFVAYRPFWEFPHSLNLQLLQKGGGDTPS